MTQHILEVAFWSLLAGALFPPILLVRQRQITARLRKKADGLEDDVRVREEEVQHLASARLPTLLDFPDEPQPGLLHGQLAGTAFAHHLQTVTGMFGASLDQARTRAGQATRATLAASMRTLQGLTTEQQLAISAMENRHDQPEVLQDLLEIDHTNSQLGRRAQAIAVLCGAWPGRQRAAAPLVDIVRGATSRVRDYQRVESHAEDDRLVVSRAVEPVVLAIAELLDNAARHSRPDTKVQVNFHPAHSGIGIVIDDAGVGLDPQELVRATELLSGNAPVDIHRLGDPPKFGFPTIGVLAARYGFSVSVDSRSPFGGVRAVVFLPDSLLTLAEAERTPYPASSATRTAPATPTTPAQPTAAAPGAPADQTAPAAASPGQVAAAAPVSTPGGLPKRRRRSPSTERATPSPRPAAARQRSPEEAASVNGAFARGTRSGRSSRTSHDEGNNDV